MTEAVRSKYTLAAIEDELISFEEIATKGMADELCAYFREHLDRPTLYGLETSLIRAKLLQQIDLDDLTDDNDRAFVLYSLALTLNLTGGWPNRAIPLYERQIEIATRLGDEAALGQSLGHYAKALRQVGRFRESEAAAIRGLRVIRKRDEPLREAVNLYWLGMGLAHRGEPSLSEAALSRALRIFRAKASPRAEGVVHAFMAQRSLWLGEYEDAIEHATKGIEIGERLFVDETYADLHGAAKVLISCLRMKGDALVQAQIAGNVSGSDGETLLKDALTRAREIEFVEEELPALRALAMLERHRGNVTQARTFLDESWHLATRGEFRLYEADSQNILAAIEMDDGNRNLAVEAAQRAFEISICDGRPFSYERGVMDSSILLERLGEKIPNVTMAECEIVAITIDEIDPAGGN